MKIWVICIGYSYGVWHAAGYFTSKDAAEKWILDKLEQEKREHDEYVASLSPEDAEMWYPGEWIPTKWYSQEVSPNDNA